MGNDTSKATGTDFNSNQRTRSRDNAAEDLPSIPFLKQKVINEELAVTLKTSVYFHNYKRAVRGYLRKKPETNQMGALFRIHNRALDDANKLGLPRDSYDNLIDRVVIKMSADLNEDVIEFLIERKKLSASDKPEKKQRASEEVLGIIFGHMGDEFIEQTGRKMYDKYSRGADFEASDAEVDKEKLAKLQAQKEERLKKAAEERQRQADQWKEEAAAEEEAQRLRQEAVAIRQAEQKAISAARDQAMI